LDSRRFDDPTKALGRPSWIWHLTELSPAVPLIGNPFVKYSDCHFTSSSRFYPKGQSTEGPSAEYRVYSCRKLSWVPKGSSRIAVAAGRRGVGLSKSVGHASDRLVAMETGPFKTRRSGFRAAELLHFAIREIPRTISEGGHGYIKNCLDGRTRTLRGTGARGPESQLRTIARIQHSELVEKKSRTQEH